MTEDTTPENLEQVFKGMLKYEEVSFGDLEDRARRIFLEVEELT